ncbi:uncharacterized protein LOC134856683 [Symsagittifera roscoffensis]|uniref:uncharacterized protein LOC134856683 n=1 Tax=Symsagittifera roscoffensis TaxID=84072 RepID=UPI00307C2E3B
MSFIWDQNVQSDGSNEEFELNDESFGGAKSGQKGSRNQLQKKSEPSEHNANFEDTSSESIENISIPIVTNELEPSVWTKVSRLVRNVILFPTKATVILGVLAFVWLICCMSWVGYGLTNDHYCPADPRIPQVIAWHGILWVAFSAYIIVRLIWVEINSIKTPTCTWRVGNPDIVLRWPKELTYALDFVLCSVLISCFFFQFALIVSLTKSDTVFYSATSSDWPTCLNCCVRSVVQFGASQMFISYLGLIVTLACYLWAMGCLENIRRRLCHCDIAQTAEESTRLV